MKHLIIFLSCIALFSTANSEPDVDLIRYFDGGFTEMDAFKDIYHTADGDFYACGGFTNAGQPFLMRLAPNGRELWTYAPQGRVFESVIEAENGDAIVATFGTNMTFGATRVDSQGNLIWQNDYVPGRAYGVIELKDGDFILCGWSRINNVRHAYLLRINDEGEVVWGQEYDDGWEFHSMRETDGGIVTCGVQTVDRNTIGWVLKADFDGNVVWSHLIEPQNAASTWFSSIISDGDGGFSIGASDGGTPGIYFISADGELTDTRFINNLNVTGINCITRTEDGGYALAGSRSSGGRSYPILIRTSHHGRFLWSKDFHELVDQGAAHIWNTFYSCIALPNNVIVAAGRLWNNDFPDQYDDAVLVRIAPDPLFPEIFYRDPIDSIQYVMRADTTQFTVRARDRYGRELDYDWHTYSDSLPDDTMHNVVGERLGDTTVVLMWDAIPGDYVVACLVSNEDGAVLIGWQTRVRYLHIFAFTPDTLNLVLRRGTSVYFVLDTIRFNEGFDPDFLWTKTNLANGAVEVVEMADHATYDFPWSGDYTVEGKAYRGESSDQVTWNVAVRGVVWAFVPEALTFDVEPDSRVHFELVPSEPENESLSIQWLVDGEVAAEDTVALEWSFSRADLNRHYLVQVVVADSVEADTVSWEVMVRDLGVGKDGGIGVPPYAFESLSVSPNPFNSSITISFGLDKSAHTRLAVYDIKGREVRELLNERMKAGEQKVVWDAPSLSAGVYLVRLENGGTFATKKVVLMR